MDCMKDMAIWTKQIAEKKMEYNDFEGARKIALKAQKLYPNLENITQLLSICDVHCSAKNQMLGEKEWYGILKLEKLADELTIKKQYEHLAVYLHPDKNLYPGAKTAFKLIGKANAVLSDPTKKSIYDSKIRADKSASVQNNVSTGFSSLNQNQAMQTSASLRKEVFWARCPNCVIDYQYDRKFINTKLRCLCCRKNFMGYEIGGQGVHSGSKYVSANAKSDKQCGVQNNVSNGNQHQATKSSDSFRNDVFWTHCPNCILDYQYDRKFINTILRCQCCKIKFMASEIGDHVVCSGSKCDSPSAQVNKQCGVQNNASTGFSSLNQHQATQSNARKEVFWTHCPNCIIDYQYDRKFVNTFLRCLYCRKKFMGYEICGQGVGSGSKRVSSNVDSSADFQEKGTDPGKFRTSVLNNKGSSESNAGSSGTRKPIEPESGACTGSFSKGIQAKNANNVDGDLNAKETESCDVINSLSGIKIGAICHDDTINRETATGDLKNKTEESGKNMSSESKLEDVTTEENGYDPVEQILCRKRQHVSYNEGLDDLPNPLKRSRKLPEEKGNEQKDAFTRGDSKHDDQLSVNTVSDYSKSEFVKLGTVVREVNSREEAGADMIEIKRDKLDEGISVCYESEFNDFEKNRNESCFAVNQIWACYDNVDGMPRFYAKVNKVHTLPFELSMTWLDADPINDLYSKWVEEELPVGCGSFQLGKTEKTSLRLTFSHQVRFEKGEKEGSITIYPREGEIWALFKDWHVSWMFEPENHKAFHYEIVEVLANFDSVAGIKVCYLDKVGGFASLFQRSETSSFVVKPNELYKFSHLVPSVKMRGNEREGVPVDSFELNPTSLPLNHDDLFYPGKAMMQNESGSC